jgi:hypothetical protein
MISAKIKIRLPDGSQQSFVGRAGLGWSSPTDYEGHKGDFPGTHGRYRLQNPNKCH